jgi:hypothetical protein
MIQEYAADLAAQMGILLSRVTVDEGRTVGCLDAYLVNLTSCGHQVSALVYQNELDDPASERLELKIRSALSRLQLLLAP